MISAIPSWLTALRNSFSTEQTIEYSYGLLMAVQKNMWQLPLVETEPVMQQLLDGEEQTLDEELLKKVVESVSFKTPVAQHSIKQFDQLIHIIITKKNSVHLSSYLTGKLPVVFIECKENCTIFHEPQTSGLVFVWGAPGVHIKFMTTYRNAETIIEEKQSYLEKDAQMDWYEQCDAEGSVKSLTQTNLLGKGATMTIRNAFSGKKNVVYDLKHDTYHLADHTKSDMLTKGVLYDKAKTIYRGLIHIDENSNHCEGYETQNTLLLSETAEIDTVPNLEIANEFVSCSHGATVGKIDADQLFYLQSRGIPHKEAEKLLIDGFLQPVIDQFPKGDE